jgi:protein-S-isoprenylcysteine O-methyltransferase Ste14
MAKPASGGCHAMRTFFLLLLWCLAFAGAVFAVGLAVTIVIGIAGYESHGRSDTILMFSVIVVAFCAVLLTWAWRSRRRPRSRF